MMRLIRTLTGRSKREAAMMQQLMQDREENEQVQKEIQNKVEDIKATAKQIEAGAELITRLRKELKNAR